MIFQPKIFIDKKLSLAFILPASAMISSQAPPSHCTVKKQNAGSQGSLIINSKLAIFDTAQTLSLSIINVLYYNQRGSVLVGSGIRSLEATPLPSSEHTSLAMDQTERDLGLGLTLPHHRSWMLLDLKSIHSRSHLCLVFGVLSRGWENK